MIGLGRDLLRILREQKAAMFGAIVVVIYCLVAIFGPIFVHISNVSHPGRAYQAPSLHHPLGMDPFGRDVLAALIVGTRPIMEIGILAAIMSIGVGVIIGLTTGYLGGVVDSVIMRITDIFLTIPGLPLVIVIAALIHSANPVVLAAILSVQAWAGLARAVRSQALSLRTSTFIEAARGQALPLRHMIGRQLLPNVGPYVAIHFLLAVTGAIYAEVGLFLLGIAPISGTNWGIMINIAQAQGALYTTRSATYLLAPMFAIVLLQVAFVLFSRALDDLFNPRMRVRA
jgi:peptide/nickel transport system permease protein